ncbi:MAG: type II toxin-antitoxin system RelE family toxin [Chthoniobacterales bacterium]
MERAAKKDLRKLPEEIHSRVIESILRLATNPRPPGSKKLAGSTTDWRIRIGDYRVLYDIADKVRIVRVYRVRHRRDVYK